MQDRATTDARGEGPTRGCEQCISLVMRGFEVYSVSVLDHDTTVSSPCTLRYHILDAFMYSFRCYRWNICHFGTHFFRVSYGIPGGKQQAELGMLEPAGCIPYTLAVACAHR